MLNFTQNLISCSIFETNLQISLRLLLNKIYIEILNQIYAHFSRFDDLINILFEVKLKFDFISI